MEYNESNFFYLKNTSIEKYYKELIKAEYMCEYFPMVTKIIGRKVIEIFLKEVAEKYTIEANVPIWKLIKNIKSSQKFFIPEEIYKYIEIVLVNAYEHSSYNHKVKRIFKHPIEILETIHNIFCWYLKTTEIKLIEKVKGLTFKAPSTIEYLQKEIIKINEDINLKDREINRLRQKLIDESSQLKNISNINNTIIAIKEEKSYLENMQVVLKKKVQEQKKQVLDMEKEYNTYAKKLDNLNEKFNESQELIFVKESQLVKAEIQKQEVMDLITRLEEQDDSIKRIQHYLEEELKTVRQAYENLVDLVKVYEDNLETIEFSYDKSLQKVLENQQKNIMIKINFEDRIFNENMIAYSQNISEGKKKALIFKEILNEKINKEIKYELFYRGFLSLTGRELRILYIIVNSINIPFLSGSSKELILKSTEDKLLELIHKKLEELKNVRDDEIKLVIYYKLIKLAQIPTGNMYNRKHFIQALDRIVDKAYEFLVGKEEFQGGLNKIDAISIHYLGKVIHTLKYRDTNLQINDELVNRIYKNIMHLKNREENLNKPQIYYEKFNLDIMTENMLKGNIKAYPFEFLSIMIQMGSSTLYVEFYNIILQVYSLIEKRFQIKQGKEPSSEILPNEYFMVLMFLASKDNSANEKVQENLLPLLVMEIINIDFIVHNDVVNLASYKEMINLWKQKQHKYNDILIQKEEKENELKLLIEEKQSLESNNNELLKKHDALAERYNNYNEEFKNIIMSSEKRVLLPSYLNYDELRNKKEIAEKNINESKNKFGTFKNMLSLGLWKEKASKFVNESNMLDAEKALIEEAKKKPYFKKDYEVFSKLEEEINQMKILLNKNKEYIENKNSLIQNMKAKIDELEKQLNAIRDIYLDIEELY